MSKTWRITFHGTQSLTGLITHLVTHSLTNSLTNPCFGDLIYVTVAEEDASSKVVNVVADVENDVEERLTIALLQLTLWQLACYDCLDSSFGKSTLLLGPLCLWQCLTWILLRRINASNVLFAPFFLLSQTGSFILQNMMYLFCKVLYSIKLV